MEIPLPTTDNFWLTLLVFILFGAPAVFSKTAAKLPWAFGALGKWWQNRSANNSSAQRIVTQANLSKIIDARVEEKVGHLREEVEQLRREVDDQGGYLVYDASWHRRHRASGAGGRSVPRQSAGRSGRGSAPSTAGPSAPSWRGTGRLRPRGSFQGWLWQRLFQMVQSSAYYLDVDVIRIC